MILSAAWGGSFNKAVAERRRARTGKEDLVLLGGPGVSRGLSLLQISLADGVWRGPVG
jgi:hypothetical protein